ncbi:MAG: amidohydrolase family protein [Holophagales bacterium]|nr:amidohydrolase family protein [Holophagales bacterium]
MPRASDLPSRAPARSRAGAVSGRSRSHRDADLFSPPLARKALGLLALALPLFSAPAFADRQPHVHALTGARIVVAPGQVIESGNLILRDGIVEAVGADVAVPADARVWELEGLTLYPGLIESFRLRDWPMPETEDDEAPQATHPNILVRPERDMMHHAGSEGDTKKLRDAGFTTAVVVPKPGLFRGSSVLLSLGDGPVARNILARGVAQNVKLTTSGDGYPGSLMGAVALLRQTVHDARWHTAAQKAYAADPKQQRPEYSLPLEVLGPAAAGKAKVVMESTDLLDALRLASLAEELGLDASIVGTGEEYRRLGDVAATGLPWLLPVDFPDAPKVGDEDDLTVDTEKLLHWKLAPETPQRMAEAGVPFALTSHHLSEPKKLHPMLAKAIERGFTADDALAALTTIPARMLGIAERAGTLEAGKWGNVLVVDGELFAEKTQIRAVWIDGKHYELKETKPPTVDPLGTWDLVIDAGPGGQIPVTVTLTGSVESLEGTIGTAGGVLPLAEAEVSGDTVNFNFDSTPLGMPGSISFAMKIEGDSASGSGVSPQGNFTFEGDRTGRPDENGLTSGRALGDLRELAQEVHR